MKVSQIPRRGSILLWALAIQVVLCRSGVFASDGTKACGIMSESESDRKILSRLEPLTHKNFSVDFEEGEESYTYVFQLCGDAGGVPSAGVVQIDKKSPNKKTVIGRYNTTRVIGGSDWVMVTYENGDLYDAHCSKSPRMAISMIFCDRNADIGQLESAIEHRDKKFDCLYLFELRSSVVCPVIESHLSAGSIILIIGFSLLAVYLIGGFLYQRLIVGAKGMEQFPNYAFWVEVGNLTADGCDFVCRSKNRDEAPAYRGVSTDALEEEPEERDDHLLPM